VQIEDRGGVGTISCEPPGVQLLPVADGDPMVLEGIALAVEAPPGVLRGTEDELALAGIGEVGAAADEGYAGEERSRA
jgi:hypothetical protein